MNFQKTDPAVERVKKYHWREWCTFVRAAHSAIHADPSARKVKLPGRVELLPAFHEFKAEAYDGNITLTLPVCNGLELKPVFVPVKSSEKLTLNHLRSSTFVFTELGRMYLVGDRTIIANGGELQYYPLVEVDGVLTCEHIAGDGDRVRKPVEVRDMMPWTLDLEWVEQYRSQLLSLQFLLSKLSQPSPS